jgi:hypothetical protein
MIIPRFRRQPVLPVLIISAIASLHPCVPVSFFCVCSPILADAPRESQLRNRALPEPQAKPVTIPESSRVGSDRNAKRRPSLKNVGTNSVAGGGLFGAEAGV